MPTLVFVAAHPDDDTFAIGRSIAIHRSDPDLRFVLIVATDGEAGEIAPDVDATRATLGSIRRLEDAASWETIGRPPDRLLWLGLRDGGLPDLDPALLLEPIWEIFSQERPDVVATFGPDGVTAHPDHLAVGRATTDAFMRGVDSGSSAFRRLLYGGIPQSQIDRWNANLADEGLPTWDASVPYHIRGIPDETIGITVDTRQVAELAVAAIRAHRSQWSPLQMDVSDEVLAKSLRREDWVIAWPSLSQGGPVLTDILEGI